MISTNCRVVALSALLLFAGCIEQQSARFEECGPDLLAVSTEAPERPRLFLTGQLLSDFRSGQLDGLQQDMLDRLYVVAQKYSKDPLPLQRQLQDESGVRTYGDKLPYLGLAYLVSGNRDYFDAARDLAMALARAPRWGGNSDIGAAHVLAGLAITYDWLFHELTGDERRQIRSAMIARGGVLEQSLRSASLWWAQEHSLLQNHNYVNSAAIALAARSLAGEFDEADRWIDLVDRNFDQVMQLLGADGASHEGVAYWSYGLEAILLYYLAVDASPLALSYLQEATAFRLHMSAPGFAAVAPYSDAAAIDYKGPGHLLRALAQLYCDSTAQWLARRIEDARNDRTYSWLDPLWYSPAIPARSQPGPVYKYFPNLGLLSVRTSWEQSASWFIYKGGPGQGLRAQAEGVWAGSHVHPDAGQFSLWHNGRWLIADDGYVYEKRTSNHNVMLFDGEGQAGEGKRWFDMAAARKAEARVSVVENTITDAYQIVQSELGNIYNNARLKSWLRKVHALQENVFVIEDLVTVRPGAADVGMTWQLHATVEPTVIGREAFCLEDVLVAQVAGASPIEVRRHSIRADERARDDGNYERWRVTRNREVSLAEDVTTVIVLDNPFCSRGEEVVTVRDRRQIGIASATHSLVVNLERNTATAEMVRTQP